MPRELPPTAGLPISPADLFAFEKPDRFESVLAQLIQLPQVQVECSGTACMVIALSYLKTLAPERTRVVIPGYTCPLVPIAVSQAGLQPVVCDTAPDTFDFDLTRLRQLVDDRTLAVMPTHIGGMPSDTASAMAIARAHGAFVIEDAAQSLGAKVDGRSAGVSGDIGIFSLSCGKGLTIYQGGFLATTDATMRSGLRATSKKLSKNDPLIELRRTTELISYSFFYNPDALAYSYGSQLRHWLKRGKPERAVGDVFDLKTELVPVGPFRLSVGCASARNFDSFLADNATRGRARAEKLAAIPGLKVMQEPPAVSGSWPFLTVTFEEAGACARALDDLWTSGLGVTKLFIHALSGYEYLASILPGGMNLPNAESFARRTLTITNSRWLSDNDFEHIRERLFAAIGATPERNSSLNATL